MSIIKNKDMSEILKASEALFEDISEIKVLKNFNYIRTNQKRVLDITAINGGNVIEKSSASFNLKNKINS